MIQDSKRSEGSETTSQQKQSDPDSIFDTTKGQQKFKMTSANQIRFLMASLALGGYALATQAEKAHRKGWSPARVASLVGLGTGILWAAGSLESETSSADHWIEYYQKQCDRLQDKIEKR